VNKERIQRLKNTLLALPIYVWLIVFLLVPFLIVLVISLSKYSLSAPPFELFIHKNITTSSFEFSSPTLENFYILITDPLYLRALVSSIKLATISTIICLLIGYPLAVCIADAKNSTKNLLLILLLIPFWTSLVLRVYAWKTILGDYGLMNKLLLEFGFISEPLSLLDSTPAVIAGIVYCYLPFMVLPLFLSIDKIDKMIIEASRDLGCSSFASFFKIIVPLSLPGILAGSILVFIPVIGEYVIPDLLGGARVLTVGKLIWNEFFFNKDWPVASAITVCMTILFVIPVLIIQKVLIKEEIEDE
jgi:putrescine transport system permease protein